MEFSTYIHQTLTVRTNDVMLTFVLPVHRTDMLRSLCLFFSILDKKKSKIEKGRARKNIKETIQPIFG